MKQKLFSAVISAALVGCAVQQAPLTPEQAAAVSSNVEVCEAVFYLPPPAAQNASAEALRRGINCNDYMQAAMQLQQQRAAGEQARRAAAAAAMQRAFTPQPSTYQIIQPTPMPRTTTCTTTRGLGGVLQTTCQ